MRWKTMGGNEMSIIINGKITLKDVIPVVLQLSEIEQEELKQILEKRKPVNWNEEWERVTTRFHRAFERWPQEEVEADFQQALNYWEIGAGNCRLWELMHYSRSIKCTPN